MFNCGFVEARAADLHYEHEVAASAHFSKAHEVIPTAIVTHLLLTVALAVFFFFLITLLNRIELAFKF